GGDRRGGGGEGRGAQRPGWRCQRSGGRGDHRTGTGHRRGHVVNSLIPLPIVLPLLGAALSILAGRSRRVQRIIALTVLTANVGLAVAILVEVDRNGTRATQAGGWSAPVGISLVADRLSALLLVVATSMLL